jgi:hypothetical protein
MPRSFSGPTAEEQELAGLLNQALQDLGVTTLQLVGMLRDDQFTKGKKPSRATIYRRLGGTGLMENDGPELIDAILDLCSPTRRTELRRQIQQLVGKHNTNPTEPPPPTPKEIDERIVNLERELAQAEQERADLMRSADEGIGEIRRELDREKARRAAAEQTVMELQPPDPDTLAGEMAAHLAAARAAGDETLFERLISEYAADEVPSQVQVILLEGLEKRVRDVAFRLAREIGDRKYYRSIPELARLLYNNAIDSRNELLKVAGGRFYGDHLQWLSEAMSSEREYHGAPYWLLIGVAEKGDRDNWFNARYLVPDFDRHEDDFLRATARSRSVEFLRTLIDKILMLRQYQQLFLFIGAYRKPDEVLEFVDRLRQGNGRSRAAALEVLRGAGEEGDPGKAAELVALLRRHHRNRDARKILTAMSGPRRARNADDIPARIRALRASGQDTDADRMATALARHRKTRRFRKGRLDALRRAGTTMGMVLLIVLSLGWMSFWGLVSCTPLFDGEDIEVVVAGNSPIMCEPPDCQERRGWTYVLEPGETTRTVYEVTTDLRYLAADFRVAMPKSCLSDRATVIYTLTAGDHRSTGEVPVGEEQRIAFDTGGASRLTIELRIARPRPGCDATVTIADPAMHRFRSSLLQFDR